MSIKPFKYTLFTLLAGLSLGLGTQASFAQNTIDPLGDIQTHDGGSGIFSNQGSKNPFFDLMHNMQRGNQMQDSQQFSIDQQQNLDDAAAKFRQQQLERLNSRPESTQPPEEANP
ncbi:hypothetical protein PMG71_03180 [Roseofilum sp. BLCC_M154]|uniref:Uncharacterized protein n=1 Tax=Roseofilum acuticapitatum BLCC-M154 TaxID=3022444 RepID=A0ABT7ANF6_9CYAN|nr:hypothetical protein [Roseofilum acuticapitatum]MDJ1168425.1 hypothetical protein [Roseofilum acuticapitatum BLCC-M154]